MGDSIIKDLAQLAGATDTTNGSWLVSFANELGVTSPVNGSWWEAIGLDLGLTAVNGSWIQAIAIHYGATDPVNGSWLQALYDNISFTAAPVNTVAPAISGTAQVGSTLTCSQGTWTGTAPITYAYQWKRNGSNIGSATNSTYLLVAADASTTVSCTVTATNADGSASANATGVSVTFETDAQAFITAASITDATQQGAVNQLVVDLKAASIWTKMKRIYPMVGGTADKHKYDLKSLSTGTFNGGWVHSATGALPNDVNGYFDTDFNASTLTANSTHLSFYSRTNSGNNGSDIGAFLGSDYLRLSIALGGTCRSNQYNETNGRIDATAADRRGFFVATRPSNSSHKVFRNGSSIGSDTNSTSLGTLSNVNGTIYIGAAHWINAASPDQYSDRECAFASIGDGLSDADVTAFNTAVATFQTTLSRNV